MGEELFRKKSIDKLKSPENLNEYIKVSNPGVWLLLVAVVALLAGVLIWGIFGYIDTTVDVRAQAEGGRLVCTLDGEDITSIAEGAPVKVGDTEGTVTEIAETGEQTGQYRITAQADVPDGLYTVKIVTERVRPISFVLN